MSFNPQLSMVARFDDWWRVQTSLTSNCKAVFDQLKKVLEMCEQYRSKYLTACQELNNAKQTITEVKCENAKLERQLMETGKELAQVREQEKETSQQLANLKLQIRNLNQMIYDEHVDYDIRERLERLRNSSGSDSAIANESPQNPPGTKVRNNSDHSDLIENDLLNVSPPLSSYSEDYLVNDSPESEMKKYDQAIPNGDIKTSNSDIECFRTPTKSVDQLIYQTPLSEMCAELEPKAGHQWQTISSKYDFVRCFQCRKFVDFNQDYSVCHHCDLKVHKSCSAAVIKPCLNIDNQPKLYSYIASPYQKPLVPDFLMKCCQEIEKRGLHTPSIYITERANQSMHHLMMSLIHPFSKDGKEQLNRKLETLEIHSLCSMVKSFLDHLVDLNECLIPEFLCEDLMREIQSRGSSKHTEHIEEEIVKKLPLPNRDTLAFLLVHLRNVLKNRRKNGVPFEILARIFASRVIPARKTDSNEEMSKYAETQVEMMKYLLSISSEFWLKFLRPQSNSFPSMNSISFIQNYGSTLNHKDDVHNDSVNLANGDISIDKKNDVDDAKAQKFQSPCSIKSSKSSVYGTPIGNGCATRQYFPNKIFVQQKQYRQLDYSRFLFDQKY